MSKLFKEAEDWQNTAILHRSRDKWLHFSVGYKRAYEIIMEKLLGDNSDIDFLVYPILYLRRHYLELMLKEIIILGSELNGNPVEVPQGNHDLMNLWKQMQVILEEFQKETYNAPSKKFTNKIIEFHNTDSNSQNFRYPIDRNGDDNLKLLERINIRNFRDEFIEVEDYLEGIVDMLYVANDERDSV
jgi:hypothetical protein